MRAHGLARDRHARRDHVGVANRFDFLDAVAFGKFVECADELVQERHRFFRSKSAGHADEAGDVCKQNGGFGKSVGDGLARRRLEALDDAVGQDVAKNGFRFGLRAFEQG